MSKILIAEDDKFLANAYRVKLTKAGFDIKMAMDGEETLEALKEFQPDLILLDLVMPVKDGFATLEEIKKNDQWKDIPVLIASNLGQQEDIDKGLAMGAQDYIVKSNLSINDLVAKIHTITDGT
jgi:DNA-binding response OmpR family regulator